MIILDVGCGRKKIIGSIGLDFSSMSDADIILNLNVEKFPFDDSSVDFIYSSHALEHLTKYGFLHVISECYRVLKPNSQLKIVVPYFTTNINLANPFHNNNICFNEHTFRFFSSDENTNSIESKYYSSPSLPHWGLRYSANSEIGIELKTLSMFFYYFPEYADLPENEQVLARTSKLNVVDQISYSLAAIKPCPSRPETGPVSTSHDPFDYAEKQIRFINEQIDYLSMKNFDNIEFQKINKRIKGKKN